MRRRRTCLYRSSDWTTDTTRCGFAQLGSTGRKHGLMERVRNPNLLRDVRRRNPDAWNTLLNSRRPFPPAIKPGDGGLTGAVFRWPE